MVAKRVDVVVPVGRLWPNTPTGSPVEIEVFGATGEYKSGKTILGLSIAPGQHPEGHPFAGKPRTLYLDFEKSGGTYGGTGCQRVDVPARMIEQNPKNHSALDVFHWFLGCVEKLQPGQFDVLIADPITDIEAGLVEYVKKNCGMFGLTVNQVEKGGGLLWGAVKDFWKQVLLRLSAKVKCFYFTSHLRDEWKGNTPTGKREPKGKETLMELASLYLWLERKADADGKVPDAPSSIVLKQRLADTSLDPETGELTIVPLMPPRIPTATVRAIRQYIASPPDYDKLKPAERVVEAAPSEEDLLRLRLAAAEAERDTEQTRLARLARTVELRTMAEQSAGAKPQSQDQTAKVQQAAEAAKAAEAAATKAKANAERDAEIARLQKEAAEKLAACDAEGKRLMATMDPAVQPAGHVNGDKCDGNQVAEVKRLATVLKIAPDKLKEIVSRAGVAKVSELSRQHCQILIDKLAAREKAQAPAGN